MKVLICIPCLLTGGTEIQTLNLVKSLIQGKHQVSTVCYFEYLPEMVSRYQEAGSKVICLSPAGKRIRGMKGITFLYKGLKQVVQAEKPEVAHVQYGSGGYSYHIVTHDRNKKCYRHSTHCGRYLSELEVGTFHPKTLYTCIHQHHSNC